MSLRTLDKKTLLSDATSAGAGSAFGVERTKGWTFVISTTVSGTATIAIQTYIGEWFQNDTLSKCNYRR